MAPPKAPAGARQVRYVGEPFKWLTERRAAYNERHPESSFIILVPEREAVYNAREQAGLEHAKQEPHDDKASIVLYCTENHRHHTPPDHQKGDPASC